MLEPILNNNSEKIDEYLNIIYQKSNYLKIQIANNLLDKTD